MQSAPLFAARWMLPLEFCPTIWPSPAPLAQTAERLHGKNPRANAMLTCINARGAKAKPLYLSALKKASFEGVA